MSDAMSDMAHAVRLAKMHDEFLGLMLDYLLKPNKKKMATVIKKSKKTRMMKFFYRIDVGASFDEFPEYVEGFVTKLLKQDKETWSKFLFFLARDEDGGSLEEFKKISPFADKLLVAINYGYGFARLYGEVERFLSSIISDEKGFKTYSADDFFMALDKPDTENTEVFWVRSGEHGRKSPRQVEKKKK